VILLDTQLLLWAAMAPDRLTSRTRQLIEARVQPITFSHASLWEVAIKSSLGRPDFSVDAKLLHDGLLRAGFAELPIRPEHLFAVAVLPWHHRDPFDRLLLGQAKVEAGSLLTIDRTLKAYGRFVRAG
jgi:PIN domain nuclease of toxin-antitoxin system